MSYNNAIRPKCKQEKVDLVHRLRDKADRQAQKPCLLGVVGARPNFIKMQSLWPAFQANADLDCMLLHTQQHYDPALSDQFLTASGLVPDIYLPTDPMLQAEKRFLDIMQNFTEVMSIVQPKAVLVVGDVDSTLACALVAAKQQVPVIHVEAGLRCFDRNVPEELNRVLVDQLASLLFTTEVSANHHLLQEGIPQSKIHWVGNVLIDTLLNWLPHVLPLSDLRQSTRCPALIEKSYLLVTFHRRALLNSEADLVLCLKQLAALSTHWPLIWPVHPHTYRRLKEIQAEKFFLRKPIFLLEPLNYVEMISVIQHSLAVITDSGGLQEETTQLNIPCFTVRPSTERPITITSGTNTLIPNLSDLNEMVINSLTQPKKRLSPIPLWDGHTASRIAEISVSWIKALCSA